MKGKTLFKYELDDIEVARDLVDENGNYLFYIVAEFMKGLDLP